MTFCYSSLCKFHAVSEQMFTCFPLTIMYLICSISMKLDFWKEAHSHVKPKISESHQKLFSVANLIAALSAGWWAWAWLKVEKQWRCESYSTLSIKLCEQSKARLFSFSFHCVMIQSMAVAILASESWACEKLTYLQVVIFPWTPWTTAQKTCTGGGFLSELLQKHCDHARDVFKARQPTAWLSSLWPFGLHQHSDKPAERRWASGKGNVLAGCCVTVSVLITVAMSCLFVIGGKKRCVLKVFTFTK